MMMTPCPVCHGSRKIKLPYLEPVRLGAFASAPTAAELANRSRVYPCPECIESDRVKVEKLTALSHTSRRDDRISDDRYVYALRRDMARAIGEKMLEMGLIQFRTAPLDEFTTQVQATVAVATVEGAETLEARIARRQRDLAEEVATEAKRQIGIFGSYFGDTHIRKDQAGHLIADALRIVLARPRP